MAPTCSTTPPKGINPNFYRWPKSSTDAYHGNPEIYYKKKMFYCHGNTPETSQMIYITPTWNYARREEWDYPITVVDTAGGVLAARGSVSAKGLLLDGKPFIEGFLSISIEEAYPERTGKAQIVVISGESGTNTQPSGRFMIDFGVSPPFISHEMLEIGLSLFDVEIPHSALKDSFVSSDARIKIKKIDSNTYEFTGNLRGPHPTEAIYRYSRKDRTVTRIK